MAAIVQSNPYNSLLRKIGYSVGLESILERISILVDEYVNEQALTYAAWNNIVTTKYGLSGDKSVEHVANFFSSINIIKMYQKDVVPLYGLDILSILRRYFSDDENYLKATKFILTLLLLEADGDILLNLMSASFDKNKARNYITKMLYTKREHYKKAVKTPEIVKIINNVVDIKQQKQNISDKSTVFDKRQVSPFEGRKESLFGTCSDEINISDDYLKKVPQTRKGWATDLGLYAQNSLTESGRRILTEFLELKLGSENGEFTFWPYKQELAALYFTPSDIGVPAISKWDVLSHLALTNSKISMCEFDPNSVCDSVFELTKLIHQLYREGDKHKKTIRHQLPLYVLYPVVVAISFSTDKCIPDMPQILEKEFKSRERRINKINIAGTEGAVVIR